jgi:sulfur carrier protein
VGDNFPGKIRGMQILLNGEPLALDTPLTVAALLERQGLAGKRVAVEKNGEIVPKSQHPSTHLEAGDRLEIVVAVGGG